MPDDYAGLYGFDKENAERLQAEMRQATTTDVSNSTAPILGQVPTGQFGTVMAQPPPPVPTQPCSPLQSLLVSLGQELEAHRQCLLELRDRLGYGGILQPVREEDPVPAEYPQPSFEVGRIVDDFRANVVRMSLLIRDLLERLAV